MCLYSYIYVYIYRTFICFTSTLLCRSPVSHINHDTHTHPPSQMCCYNTHINTNSLKNTSAQKYALTNTHTY